MLRGLKFYRSSKERKRYFKLWVIHIHVVVIYGDALIFLHGTIIQTGTYI